MKLTIEFISRGASAKAGIPPSGMPFVIVARSFFSDAAAVCATACLDDAGRVFAAAAVGAMTAGAAGFKLLPARLELLRPPCASDNRRQQNQSHRFSLILHRAGYIEPHARQRVSDHVQRFEILIAERDVPRIDRRMNLP